MLSRVRYGALLALLICSLQARLFAVEGEAGLAPFIGDWAL